jgi:hypothetical protein
VERRRAREPQPEQAQVVAATRADVVALQEVTARTLPLWRAALAEAGLAACETGLDDAGDGAGRKVLGVLTAARGPLGGCPRPPACRGPSACCAAARARWR